MKKIIQLGDPRLEIKSENVKDILHKDTQKLIDDMLEVLNFDAEKSAGISAPQIGVNLNVAICRRIDEKKDRDSKPIWEIMINPKIIKKSKAETTFWEGCLSIQEGKLFGKVKRPAIVEVEYFDRKAKKKKIKAIDYFAHVVQHELDHLNGVLFLKYVPDPSRLYTAEELDEMYED